MQMLKGDWQEFEETAQIFENFLAEFNYNQSLKTKIKKARFAYVDKEIKNLNFYPDKKGKAIEKAKLFSFFSQNDDYLNIIKPASKIIESGYRPGNIFELCDIAISNPWLQLYYPIVALNSMWQCGNFINFPALDSCTHSTKRQLTVFRFWTEGNMIWPKCCRFLGVR